MALDIFSNDIEFGGSFSSDGVEVSFDTGNGSDFVGLTLQNASINYQQNISRIYEIGKRLYLVGGRTQGTMGVSHLIGPKKIGPAFYRKFGDVCQAATNNMNLLFRTGCHDAESGNASNRAEVNHAVIQGLAGNISANDVLYSEQMSLMFLYMTRK